jgi:hypothetical protein
LGSDVKALTLRHPWPWAITHCGKDIENRTWRPSPSQLKLNDLFAIHAGKAPTGKDLIEMRRTIGRLIISKMVPEESTVYAPPPHSSAIVAVVRFGGTTTLEGDVRLLPGWLEGPIGWHLMDTQVLPSPVPVSGKQGLWTLTADVEAKVRAQLKVQD